MSETTPRAPRGSAALEGAPEPHLDAALEEVEVATDLLSAEEVAAAKAEARKQFDAKRKKLARAKIIEQEISALERDRGGDLVGGHLDDLVSIRIDLPATADQIIIDQEMIQNGDVITRPRHVINSILETMWRNQVADHNLHGQTRDEFYRRQQPVVVTPGGAAHTAETLRVS